MTSNKSRKLKLIVTLAIIVICLFAISLSFRREPIPNVPSVYRFGTLAPFFSLSDEVNLTNATAQIVTLGQKPILRIESMDIGSCPQTEILLAQSQSFNGRDSAFNLGTVPYLTGNTNYEIPPATNTSTYRVVIIWCNLTNMLSGYAILQ